jgi:hypothetical protein
VYRERGRRRIIYIFSIKIMETKNKKDLRTLPVFPLTFDGITIYVTFGVLEGFIEAGVASYRERQMYDEVKFLFV